jgi:hypothetical protein
MTIAPALAVLGAAVLLGGWLGTRYLMGERNNRILVGLHLILGIAGLEVLMLLLKGAPDGRAAVTGSTGMIAALILAVAMFTGLLVPILAPSRPRTIGPMIAVHAVVAAVGFGLLLLWALG